MSFDPSRISAAYNHNKQRHCPPGTSAPAEVLTRTCQGNEQPSQVACPCRRSEELRCLRRAQSQGLHTMGERGTEKRTSPLQSSFIWKDENGPSPIRPTLEPFLRQCWGNSQPPPPPPPPPPPEYVNLPVCHCYICASSPVCTAGVSQARPVHPRAPGFQQTCSSNHNARRQLVYSCHSPVGLTASCTWTPGESCHDQSCWGTCTWGSGHPQGSTGGGSSGNSLCCRCVGSPTTLGGRTRCLDRQLPNLKGNRAKETGHTVLLNKKIKNKKNNTFKDAKTWLTDCWNFARNK